MAAVISSAASFLTLLDEPDNRLKVHALTQIDRLVADYWTEIAIAVTSIETLYDDELFSHRNLAALVASKVHYHMGELDDALTYALGAGELLSITEESEYTLSILSKAIDKYIAIQCKMSPFPVSDTDDTLADVRLVAMVERIFESCIVNGQFEQAIGLAIESHRLDKLEEAIQRSDNHSALLSYATRVSQTLITSRDYRHKVLRTLISLFQDVERPDYASICQCHMFLNKAEAVAEILAKLTKEDGDDSLMAYQIAFDLLDNERQNFLTTVKDILKESEPLPKMVTNAILPPETDETTRIEGEADVNMSTDATDGEANASKAAETPTAKADSSIDPYTVRLRKLQQILSGEIAVELHLEFLYSNNKADLQVMKNIKSSIENRNSVCHSATVGANALMHAGTTTDTFLRQNLDWMGKATNWAKFGAIAALGVINRGHLKEAKTLMSPYLPQTSGGASSNSRYSEGAALYALGLIHADRGEPIRPFIQEALRSATHEVVQHGACLGMGLASIGTGDDTIFEEMKSVLYQDNANAGEAAGYGMGLLLAGTGSSKSEEMLAYAHETKHDKIIRGLSVGIAMTVYEQEEMADTLIEQMSREQDPILRYGGMFAVGMAYVGTANNAAIQRLLHNTVVDVSDDVKRAAVISLGFVLCGVPEQCPKTVTLLAESYNPNLRCGAAVALGISCAGTALPEAVKMLDELCSDSVDFVRQGAMIAMAMVLIQKNEALEPKVVAFRKKLEKTIADKHEETLCKMGAIIACGILDAGGRNVTISLRSRTGFNRMTAILGMLGFVQLWYWYPLIYFLSLTFKATAFIGLNHELKMPKFEIECKNKASLFAYPPPVTKEEHGPAKKVASAVLSTTAKARQRAKEKVKMQGNGEMDVDKDNAAEENGSLQHGDQENPIKTEPDNYRLANPTRVLLDQEKYIVVSEASRFQPLSQSRSSGFVLLRDTSPTQEIEYVSLSTTRTGAAEPTGTVNGTAVEEEEPGPPEAFDFDAN